MVCSQALLVIASFTSLCLCHAGLQVKSATSFKMKEITKFSDPAFQWFHEPPKWHIDESVNTLEMGPGYHGDLWMRTYYPWALKHSHFNASALLAEVHFWQNATLELEFTAAPKDVADQAGAFVLVDEGTWVKAGMENLGIGGPHLSVAVTNDGFTDWSTRPLTWNNRTVSMRLRLTKVVHDLEQGAAIYVEIWDDNLDRWELVRLLPVRAHLEHGHHGRPWRMGPMAASASETIHEFSAAFSKIYLGPKTEPCLQC